MFLFDDIIMTAVYFSLQSLIVGSFVLIFDHSMQIMQSTNKEAVNVFSSAKQHHLYMWILMCVVLQV